MALDFAKSAGWIRIWWIITLCVTGLAIWLGLHEDYNYDLMNKRTFKVNSLVIEDLANPECQFALVSPHDGNYDKVMLKVFELEDKGPKPDPSRDDHTGGPCFQLAATKSMFETKYGDELGFSDRFFIRDRQSYMAFVDALAHRAQKEHERYIEKLYLVPFFTFVVSWLVFVLLLMISRWVAAGFQKTT